MELGSILVLQFRPKDEMWRAWCPWCIFAKARQFECSSINSLSSGLGQNGLSKNGLWDYIETEFQALQAIDLPAACDVQ